MPVARIGRTSEVLATASCEELTLADIVCALGQYGSAVPRATNMPQTEGTGTMHESHWCARRGVVLCAAWAPKSDPGLGVPEALCRRVTRVSDTCSTKSSGSNKLFLSLDDQEVCAVRCTLHLYHHFAVHPCSPQYAAVVPPERYFANASCARESQQLWCRVSMWGLASALHTAAATAVHALVSGAWDGRARTVRHNGARIVVYGLSLGDVTDRTQQLVLVWPGDTEAQTHPRKDHTWMFFEDEHGRRLLLDLTAALWATDTRSLCECSPGADTIFAVPVSAGSAPSCVPSHSSSPVLFCPEDSATAYKQVRKRVRSEQLGPRVRIAERADVPQLLDEMGAGLSVRDPPRANAVSTVVLYRNCLKPHLLKAFGIQTKVLTI